MVVARACACNVIVSGAVADVRDVLYRLHQPQQVLDLPTVLDLLDLELVILGLQPLALALLP